jgi:hypothetical protein
MGNYLSSNLPALCASETELNLRQKLVGVALLHAQARIRLSCIRVVAVLAVVEVDLQLGRFS